MVGREGLRRAVGLTATVVLALLSVACASSGSAGTAAVRPGGPEPSGAAASQAPQGARSNTSDTPAGALIVRTGSLELEVKDVNAALPKGRELVASMGGYVAGSEEVHDGDKQVATITYRIPVERWQDAINGLRGLADSVVHESTQAEEVTAQVVDLDARLVNLRASERSLQDIMTRAVSIAEVLAVQDKLTQVREQIERIAAQQKDLTGRAALATLSVAWETPPVAAVAEARSGWDLGREIDHAAAQTVAAGQTFASFLVWLIVVGVPVLGPIILLTVVGVVLYRRWAAKQPARVTHVGWGPPGPGPGPAPRGPTGWGTPGGSGAGGHGPASPGPGGAPRAAPDPGAEPPVAGEPAEPGAPAVG